MKREQSGWRKSSYSQIEGNCVEIAGVPDGTAVRDGKDPAGPVLIVAPVQWAAFTSAISRGDIG